MTGLGLGRDGGGGGEVARDLGAERVAPPAEASGEMKEVVAASLDEETTSFFRAAPRLAGHNGFADVPEERRRDSQKFRIGDERTLLIAHQDGHIEGAGNVPRLKLLDGPYVEIQGAQG